MSRKNELKSDPGNTINMIDILSLLCPDGKVKYIETLLRIMKSTENIGTYTEDVLESMKNDYGVEREYLTGYNTIQLIHIKDFLDNMFDLTDVHMFQKFCNFNERCLIADNDLSTYKTFKDIEISVNNAELKMVEKEMESQIVKLFENNEWLILKPLTHEASKKYGMGTKWCTTTENDATHFKKYGKGILIYTLNKKTNYKIATYKSFTDNEFSFWNAADDRVDSLITELPDEILGLIRKHVTVCKTGNIDLKNEQVQVR